MCKQCKALNTEATKTTPTIKEAEPPRYAGKCECCGKLIPLEDLENNKAIEVNGFLFCDDECARHEEFERCKECGKWFYVNNGVITDGNGWEDYYCCESCAESQGYKKCNYCGEWHSACEMFTPTIWYDDGVYCDVDCAERDGWIYCEECDEWHNARRGYPCPDGWEEDEWNYKNPKIKGYHCHNYQIEPRFIDEEEREKFRRNPQKVAILGIELELESEKCASSQSRLIERINSTINDITPFNDNNRHSEPFCWFEEDGSLNNTGVEVITQPCSEKFWKKYGSLFEKLITEACEYAYYETLSTENGGLHIHINKEFASGKDKNKTARRVQAFLSLSNYQKFIENTGRPEKDGIYYNPSGAGGSDAVYRIVQNKKAHSLSDSHYQAVSERANTYEIRIFNNEVGRITEHITDTLDLWRAAKNISDKSLRTLNHWLTLSND